MHEREGTQLQCRQGARPATAQELHCISGDCLSHFDRVSYRKKRDTRNCAWESQRATLLVFDSLCLQLPLTGRVDKAVHADYCQVRKIMESCDASCTQLWVLSHRL
jgi:hypothetical protein